MRKYLIPVLAIILLTACSKPREQVNSLDELLAKHFAAIGATNLKNSQSILHRDIISLTPDGKAGTSIEVLVKKPNNYFFKSIENGDTVIFANNNQINWAFIQKEYKERPSEKNGNTFNMYAYGFASLLFGKMNNWTMEFTGKEFFNGKELYRIKVIQPESGESVRDSVYLYDLDPDTSLILRMTNGGLTQYYFDYKEVKGVKYASKVSSDYEGIKGENYFSGTIIEFKLDAELPDQLFEPGLLKNRK